MGAKHDFDEWSSLYLSQFHQEELRNGQNGFFRGSKAFSSVNNKTEASQVPLMKRNGTSIFEDESKLSINYTPYPLIHRYNAISSLLNFFKIVIECPGTYSRKVFLSGDSGSGRTTVAKVFGRFIVDLVADKYEFKYVHVFCNQNLTLLDVLLKVLETIGLESDTLKKSVREVIQLIRREIRKRNLYVIICLDDSEDILLKKEQIITSLMRSKKGDLNEDNRLSFIIIVVRDAIKAHFSKEVKSLCIGPDVLLQRYKYSEIKDILGERVKDAFKKGAVLKRSVKAIGRLCSGNAKAAITILWNAGKFADKDDSLKVTPMHVRRACKSLKPLIDFGKSIHFTLTQKLILYAIIRGIEQKTRDNLTGLEVWDEYREVCCELDLKYITKERMSIELLGLELFSGFIDLEAKPAAKSGAKEEETEVVHILLPTTKLKQIVFHHLRTESVWYFIRNKAESGV